MAAVLGLQASAFYSAPNQLHGYGCSWQQTTYAEPHNCRNCGAPVPSSHPLQNYRGPAVCNYCKSEQ